MKILNNISCVGYHLFRRCWRNKTLFLHFRERFRLLFSKWMDKCESWKETVTVIWISLLFASTKGLSAATECRWDLSRKYRCFLPVLTIAVLSKNFVVYFAYGQQKENLHFFKDCKENCTHSNVFVFSPFKALWIFFLTLSLSPVDSKNQVVLISSSCKRSPVSFM